MVELLATIVVLGLLMAVAIGAVSLVLNSSEENFYESLEKQVIMAAESYYADHRGSLPQAIGQKRRVTLQTLIKNNYLKKGSVVDYGKRECDTANSYVTVTKTSKSDYIYTLHLICPAKTIDHDKTAAKSLNIKITFDWDSTKVEASKANIKISVNGSISKIASYQYSIYKNGQLVYNSTSVSASNVEELEKTIKLKKYVPGNIKMVVTAYDIHGNSKTQSNFVDIQNNDVPSCGKISPLYDLEKAKDWTNSKSASRKITVKCNNTSVACKKKSASKTFTEDTAEGYITIEGTNGKTHECMVPVMIDKTAPSCGDTKDSTVWTSENREVSVVCEDATSGCSENEFSTLFGKEGTVIKKDKITIEDVAGNTKECDVNVYVDQVLPTCTISKQNITETSLQLVVSASDGKDQSGVDSNGYSFDGKKYSSSKITTVTEDGKYTAYVKDNAGNVGTCSVDVDEFVKEYKITYHLNDGTNSSSNPATYIEGTGTKLYDATKKNYTFEGWYTDSKFTTKVTSISATATGDIDLYAKWSATPPTCGTISGNGSSSSGWASSRTVTVGCKNPDGTACPSKSATYTTSTSSSYSKSITITGSNGATESCSFYVYRIDSGTPSVSYAGAAGATQCPGGSAYNWLDYRYIFNISNTASGFRASGSRMVVTISGVGTGTYNYGSSRVSSGREFGCAAWSTSQYWFARSSKPSITATACNNAGRCGSRSA